MAGLLQTSGLGSIVAHAVVAAIVGFGGTVALVVAAAQALGASTVQTISWVTALCLAKAVPAAWISVRYRIPAIMAWSTPGAAIIAGSSGIGFEASIGAFLLSAVLIILSGTFAGIGRLVERIPMSIAAAMLGGVLLRFVLAAFESLPKTPELVLPLLLVFVALRPRQPALAVVAVLVVGVGLAAGLGLIGPGAFDQPLGTLVWTSPSFDPAVLLGLGVPLFLVTMASQNLAGFAVLRAAGYPVPASACLVGTGVASLLSAPFGAHAVNMAAITAAICSGPDAHPDPAQRWLAGPFYALTYLLFAAFAGALIGILAALPPALIATVAGTALLGPLAGAVSTALAKEQERIAAIMTLAVTASGIGVLGIGSAFWGLATGLFVLGLEALVRARPT